MDEVRDISMMDNDRQGAERPEGSPHPLHVDRAPASGMEAKEDGSEFVRYDPERAHKAVGDPGWTKFIPETCGACRAKELAQLAIPGEEA